MKMKPIYRQNFHEAEYFYKVEYSIGYFFENYKTSTFCSYVIKRFYSMYE